MIFEYKGKTYDTARSTGETSTNRLQVTDDDELKLTVVHSYFQDSETDLLKHNELDILFSLALISARYNDLIEGLGTDYEPIAGLYPEWILNALSLRQRQGSIDIAKWAR